MAEIKIPTTAPLTGKAALIVGTIGGLVVAGAQFIPAPWSTLAMIAGFIACAVAGLAAKPPSVIEGKPVLQGTALTVTTSIGLLLQQMVLPLLPADGWVHAVAWGVLALLAWLTGRALPVPGALQVPVQTAPPAPVETKADAIDTIRKGPPEA